MNVEKNTNFSWKHFLSIQNNTVRILCLRFFSSLHSSKYVITQSYFSSHWPNQRSQRTYRDTEQYFQKRISKWVKSLSKYYVFTFSNELNCVFWTKLTWVHVTFWWKNCILNIFKSSAFFSHSTKQNVIHC